MATFSERLKQYREKLKEKDKKWTQEYVAKKIGVARVTYTGYENGTKLPPIDTVNKIAELFGVNTDYLMGRSNDPRLSADEDKEVDKKVKELMEIIESMPEEKRNEMKEKILAYARGLADASKLDKN
ncbi:transcriptional regulator [Caldibacillus phage CBP1]|uniref:Putative transcriptional regulator n=1 Tax=Caldibacillus debilis GB1 TaxID=1339248 RepID=A0A420VIL6_9BACI|nr:helix-turn-helix transcriptional regulator [Caldibacillus debilis]ATB52696.1 transcriptional regulator [Caldibacillus phage CBP1]RKO63524.1 putative transcriptional regulator [Caldibacillus debilis GB1]